MLLVGAWFYGEVCWKNESLVLVSSGRKTVYICDGRFLTVSFGEGFTFKLPLEQKQAPIITDSPAAIFRSH